MYFSMTANASATFALTRQIISSRAVAPSFVDVVVVVVILKTLGILNLIEC